MNFHSWLDHVLGLQVAPADMTMMQMGARTLIVFLFGVALVRLADRRFMGYNAGFDLLLAIVLGAVISRAINGQANFFPTLGAGALLVLLHHVLGMMACRWHWVSRLIKGMPLSLIEGGKIVPSALRQARMTTDDLEENLRLHGRVTSVECVQEARLERNGSVSVITGNSSMGPERAGLDN